eukprot:m.20058 g.20058  ORF g.20058 m.20058 type:complete len:70 (-) comp10110_c0_seq1:180-389(-)
MPATRRIEQANNSFAKNVNKRGKVPVTKLDKKDGPAVSNVVIGLFVFVLCGSVVFQLLQSIQAGFPVGG